VAGEREGGVATDASVCAAEVLEEFCRSFVELRRGCEEFGKELGVRTVQGEGGVYRARDGKELCAYLLEAGVEGRSGELRRAFEELMVHELALVEGVTAGGRALVERLSPEAIGRASGGVWLLRAARRWKELEARHEELSGDGGAVSEVLFGKEFARGYAGAMARFSGSGDAPAAPGDASQRGEGEGAPWQNGPAAGEEPRVRSVAHEECTRTGSLAISIEVLT
jgi:type VI secretion system protein